jgi:5-methylcytosine-specific restriction endonuclease McrA
MPDCPLCERDVPEQNVSDHHLVPKSRGGKETLTICVDCHRQLHALFTNKQLADEYNTVEAIMADERFAKFAKWIAKRPAERRMAKAKRAKGTRKRGRGG